MPKYVLDYSKIDSIGELDLKTGKIKKLHKINNKRFPNDCSYKCPYYSCYDLSIDDWVSRCSLLNSECDDCDEGYSLLLCPSPLAEYAIEPEPEKVYNVETKTTEWYFANGDVLYMKTIN